MKFAATIWIFYILQIQKKIVSAKTICGNTVSRIGPQTNSLLYGFDQKKSAMLSSTNQFYPCKKQNLLNKWNTKLHNVIWQEN